MEERLLLSRRRFLESAAVVTGSAVLNGCLRPIPTALWDPNPCSPLTIDVHCHFFNGSDLQVESFLKTYIHQSGKYTNYIKLTPLAQDFEWAKAPTAKEEMKKLPSQKPRSKEPSAKPDQDSATQAQDKRQRSRRTRSQDAQSVPSKHARQALEGGGVHLVEEYLQYRYVTLADYLTLYSKFVNRGESRPNVRTIDLAIAHLVDYDWPLSNGKAPRTPLPAQIELMKKISIVSKGRVHTFAPFDPFREIAYQAGHRQCNWSPLECLKMWVANAGCIGVKLYPTMGFAPYGNSEVDPECWCGVWEWIPDVASVPYEGGKRAPLGQRLDAVLGELYDWCLSMDLPVMAHTDLTNGPSEEFDHLAEAKYWRALRSCFGGLRLNFGHLGGFEDTYAEDWENSSTPPATNVNARELVALMSRENGAPGCNFYADSAFNEYILTDPCDLLEVYRAALSWKGPGQYRPMLPDRLMYGSDWSLLMQQEHMEQYFNDFIRLYGRLDGEWQKEGKDTPEKTKLSERFFGYNAVDYLGLGTGGRNRERLMKFYKCQPMDFKGRSQPIWMDKIDRIGS